MNEDKSPRNNPNRIDTQRSIISFNAINLLDRDIMQSLKNILECPLIDDVKFLQKLQEIEATQRLGNDVDLENKIAELKDELKEKEDEINDLENELIEAETVTASSEEHGLLGVQIDEAFDAIMEHPQTNQIRFLQLLEQYTLIGYK